MVAVTELSADIDSEFLLVTAAVAVVTGASAVGTAAVTGEISAIGCAEGMSHLSPVLQQCCPGL